MASDTSMTLKSFSKCSPSNLDVFYLETHQINDLLLENSSRTSSEENCLISKQHGMQKMQKSIEPNINWQFKQLNKN